MPLSIAPHCLDNPGVQEEENQDGQDSWKQVVYQKNGKETFSEEIQSSTHLVCEHYGNSARNLTENVL